MTYEPARSSACLKKIRAHETHFGASDVSPSDAELTKDGRVIFPVAITGVAPVVDLPKVVDAELRLTGDVLARIFLGEINQWNAPEIAKSNPGTTLPDTQIKVVVRADGSGTTYNFADYLAIWTANSQNSRQMPFAARSRVANGSTKGRSPAP